MKKFFEKAGVPLLIVLIIYFCWLSFDKTCHRKELQQLRDCNDGQHKLTRWKANVLYGQDTITRSCRCGYKEIRYLSVCETCRTMFDLPTK